MLALWMAIIRLYTGGWMAAAVSAASTNGSIPPSAYQFFRKLVLGPVFMAVSGLWVLAAAVLLRPHKAVAECSAVCSEPRRAAAVTLLVMLTAVSIFLHAAISIQLTRYYVPVLALAYVLLWVGSPLGRHSRWVLLACHGVFAAFVLFHPIRYLNAEDGLGWVRCTHGHVQFDRELTRLVRETPGSISAPYPIADQLTSPYLGYVTDPLELTDTMAKNRQASVLEQSRVRWVVETRNSPAIRLDPGYRWTAVTRSSCLDATLFRGERLF